MRSQTLYQATAYASLALTVGGCASLGSRSTGAPRPAPISHVVLVKLADPSEADALIVHCDANLRTIPSVVSYACGHHVDTGRTNIDSDYDVAIYIGFDSTEGYADYVVHPLHVDVLQTWGDRLEWIRIHDFLDTTP
ncbi:MAG: hypothetical protein DHS20C14_06400 [Phycisphaeraceae bacterium]|nr:MAG: hypothetical protein DHS20C14_06400 [Phycisphaeraceae bacterium]